jgi:uncharacterized protein (TIGR04255 family)
VIDFRIEPRLQVSKIRELSAELEGDFPARSDIRLRMFGFEADKVDIKASTVDHGVVGQRLETEDGKYVLQIKNDGLTFSRLAPYEDWETFSGKARGYWDKYLKLMDGIVVSRVATRFINVMDLPLPILNFKDYLVAPPEVPENLPQELAGFLSRLVIVNKNIESAAAVTLALEDPSGEKISVVLDIDAFKNMNAEADSEAIWQTLEALRNFKNDIFFESITEKTARIFE